MILQNEIQKEWFKEEIQALIQEHEGTISNERLWAKGAPDTETAQMHEDNIQEHLSYIEYLKFLLTTMV